MTMHGRLSAKTLARAWACLVGILLVGCIPPAPEGQLFSFAVIADPHVTSSSPDTAEKLAACVDWLNAHHDDEDKGIVLAFVVGDMGGSRGALAKGVLDGLEIPYVPLIGDNDVSWSGGGSGEDAYFTGGREFEGTFGAVYDDLATILENWTKAPTPVWNPEIGQQSTLHNFSFDHEGVHFVCLDWATRRNVPTPENPLQTEQADLHDFAGGTWPWFTDDVAGCSKDGEENIVMLSHHPMHVAPVIGGLPVNLAAFDQAELAQVEAFTAGYGDHVYANIAGHYHVDFLESMPVGKYDVYVTRAVHDALPGRMKLVRAYRDGSGPFTYHHEYVQLPVAAQDLR